MKAIKMSGTRAIAMGTLGIMTLGGLVVTPTPAQATKSSTWKKLAIGAGAVAGYGLLKHNGRATTLGAIGAAGSYYMYKKTKKKENRRKAWYQHRYGGDWQKHYAAGR